MEKIFKKLFDFVKNNIVRVILTVILLSFNYIFLAETIHSSIEIFISRILEITSNYGYSFFYIFINQFINILKFSIIYFILFGGKKIEVDDSSEKVLVKGKRIKRLLILFLILITLDFLDYLFFVNFQNENIKIFMGKFVYRLIDLDYEVLTIDEKLKVLFNGTLFLLIRGFLEIFIVLNLLSVFIILGDRGKSDFSIVNMLEHFSKTVSKKVAIFISYIFSVMDFFLIRAGNVFFENDSIKMSMITKGYFRDKLINSLETPFNFPSIIVVFGLVLVFILIKIIIESDEMLVTTKVLKNKNIKYYLTNFFCILLTQGFALVLIVHLIIYNIKSISFFTIFIVFPMLFSVLLSFELLVYKINFRYLGENVKLNFDKFLNLIAVSFGLCFFYLVILNILSTIFYNTNDTIKVFLILGGFLLFVILYIGFIYFNMKSFSILREDKKVVVKLVERFVNLEALIIIGIVLSYTLVSIGLGYTYTNLNPVLYFIILFLIKGYINLTLCDYYLRVTKEGTKTNDKNIEIGNIEENKTEVIVEKDNNNENLS